MGAFHKLVIFTLLIGVIFPHTTTAQLRQKYYAKTCPRVESIVRQAVQQKIKETFVTIPSVLRLFFHDCFVNGCDASVMIQSTPTNTAEKDHPDNLSLAGDGFDTVIKAKAALDAYPGCKNNVSCADILALATRDVVNIAGGLFWQVELGRLDGLVSKASSVNGKLPKASDKVSKLSSMFASHGLSQADMVALSGAHTVGFSHCDQFSNRIYGFTPANPVDPTLNQQFANQLMGMCPKDVDPRIAVNIDPNTPHAFDNMYYKNLIQGKGLFTSDQDLYTDPRTQPMVKNWAQNSISFKQAFANAMIKLGRVGVKSGKNGNIRVRCDAFN